MHVGRICSREIDLGKADEAVADSARRMHQRKVGTLVVLDDQRHPVGIVTDRDLALRVVAEGRDPNQTRLSQVMTPHPHTIAEDAPIETAIAAMRTGAFRRLPVTDDQGRMVGLVSLDDILSLMAEEMRDIGRVVDAESPDTLAR